MDLSLSVREAVLILDPLCRCICVDTNPTPPFPFMPSDYQGGGDLRQFRFLGRFLSVFVSQKIATGSGNVGELFDAFDYARWVQSQRSRGAKKKKKKKQKPDGSSGETAEATEATKGTDGEAAGSLRIPNPDDAAAMQAEKERIVGELVGLVDAHVSAWCAQVDLVALFNTNRGHFFDLLAYSRVLRGAAFAEASQAGSRVKV